MDIRDFVVKPGKRVNLKDFDAGDTCEFSDKESAARALAQDIVQLSELQERLSASATHGVLIIFQGMDSAGKDGAIKHVMSGVNPQGVSVNSFKTPSAEELRHDYLWRAHNVMPERGRIGIFNRSYYEDVVVTRVHPELLGGFQETEHSDGEAFWHRRFKDLNRFERYLTRNSLVVIKFFLNISREEQKKRLLERLDDPDKHWKFSLSDVQQRQYWDRYMEVYGKMLAATSTAWAPWYTVPADHKWFTRVAVAKIIIERLHALELDYPRDSSALKAELGEQKALLESE